jgi:hypothetical protein
MARKRPFSQKKENVNDLNKQMMGINMVKPPLGNKDFKIPPTNRPKTNNILPINHELAKNKLKLIMKQQNEAEYYLRTEKKKSLYDILTYTSASK